MSQRQERMMYLKILRLTEMAEDRANAMSYCISCGKQFIRHFEKVKHDIENDSPELKHHIHEMQTWWDTVRSMKLKSNKKYLSDKFLTDSFFTAGAFVEDFLDKKYVSSYNQMYRKLLKNRKLDIEDVIFD